MKKKNSYLVILLFLIFLLLAFYNQDRDIVQKSLLSNEDLMKTSQPTTFTFGISNNPHTIDPIDCFDLNSGHYIRQVAETLFWINISDPDYPLEPLLVDSYSWDISNTNLTLNLKSGIYFHDGFIFNASAVKWNVERWLYLTNATGTLSGVPEAAPSTLYFFSDGTPIINRSEVLSEFSVKIVLNQPFGPFTSLLSYISNAIISPYSHIQTDYIDTYSGDLVGTGPFTFEYVIADVEARFERYETYWQSPSDISPLIFVILTDPITRQNSMLALDVDMINGVDPTYLDLYEATPDIVVQYGGTNMIYWYLGLNNNNLNTTWRKAISYTYNYTYVYQVIREGYAERGCPGVPKGISGHNSSVQANLPTLNRPLARTIMQSMGFGVGFDINSDTQWLAQAASSPFNTFDINRLLGSTTNQPVNELFIENIEYQHKGAYGRIFFQIIYIECSYNNLNVLLH